MIADEYKALKAEAPEIGIDLALQRLAQLVAGAKSAELKSLAGSWCKSGKEAKAFMKRVITTLCADRARESWI